MLFFRWELVTHNVSEQFVDVEYPPIGTGLGCQITGCAKRIPAPMYVNAHSLAPPSLIPLCFARTGNQKSEQKHAFWLAQVSLSLMVDAQIESLNLSCGSVLQTLIPLLDLSWVLGWVV